MDPSDYTPANRAYWDDMAHEWVEAGERRWRSPPVWGIWDVPESELGLLPDDMTGIRAIELGCGTGYVSAWMVRRGADVVGIDNSAKQLETAERLKAEHALDIDFRHGVAESLPFPDEAFDFAISEYGAALWSDPFVWIQEAHRVLRQGGELVLLSSSAWTVVCSPHSGAIPLEEQLHRPYFDMHLTDWRDVDIEPGGIEFHLPLGEWFALFDETGFDVTGFLEPRPPEPSEDLRFFVTASWAHKYPSEQVWRLRKRISA